MSQPSPIPHNASNLRELPMSLAIRNGRCGTCPKLLTNYLNKMDEVAGQLPNEHKINLHTRVLDVLMETICDDLIAKCWRGWCLDNIYRPLGALRCLSKTEAECRNLAKLEAQMRMLSYYFL